MLQTFQDILLENEQQSKNLFIQLIWLYAEILIQIFKLRISQFNMKYTKIIRSLLLTSDFLLLPLVGMQISTDIMWTTFDFIFAGSIIFIALLSFEFLISKISNIEFKLASGLTVASTTFLLWTNLAVGLIGNENEAANYMYLVVIAVIIAGTAISKFKPRNMAYTLFVAALIQASITLIALFMQMYNYLESSLTEILSVNGFFIGLFMLSGLLFLRSVKNKQIASLNPQIS
ncbi:MAG: hypothetical protein OHK0017_08330 [Patescibacteria group bacterium]